MITIHKGIRKAVLTGAAPDQSGKPASRPPGALGLHALAAQLAAHPDLRVSVITYQDGHEELEVLNTGPPHHDATTIDPARFACPPAQVPGQVLSLTGESGIQDAVDIIRAILAKANSPGQGSPVPDTARHM